MLDCGGIHFIDQGDGRNLSEVDRFNVEMFKNPQWGNERTSGAVSELISRPRKKPGAREIRNTLGTRGLLFLLLLLIIHTYTTHPLVFPLRKLCEASTRSRVCRETDGKQPQTYGCSSVGAHNGTRCHPRGRAWRRDHGDDRKVPAAFHDGFAQRIRICLKGEFRFLHQARGMRVYDGEIQPWGRSREATCSVSVVEEEIYLIFKLFLQFPG
jgi:hypothetical protein